MVIMPDCQPKIYQMMTRFGTTYITYLPILYFIRSWIQQKQFVQSNEMGAVLSITITYIDSLGNIIVPFFVEMY